MARRSPKGSCGPRRRSAVGADDDEGAISVGIDEAETDAAGRMLFRLARDIDVAALLGRGQIFANVGSHVAQRRLAARGVPAERRADACLREAVETRRGARR